MRRLLMVGLAENAAAKTMVRSHKGINGAFVVETSGEGKSGLAVQLEGSDFETVWQLQEGGEGGILILNKVSFAYNQTHVSNEQLRLSRVRRSFRRWIMAVWLSGYVANQKS